MNRNFRWAISLAAVILASSAIVALLAAQPGTPSSPKKGRTIEILFLGHNSTHHDSARFEPMLATAIESEGFHFTYTPDPNDLNPANLAKYDALLIYANHTTITPDQEKALLDFVNSGKGFLPIHCASYCFQNSPAYIAMVGAQFLKHGTGEFTATIVQPNHPVLDGIQAFQVWDETYVHTKINPDKTVLMERVDDSGREPWTWVREQGKGRVFYTAYGHDERVWGHPMFQRLVRNGILWAVGPAVRAEWADNKREKEKGKREKGKGKRKVNEAASAARHQAFYLFPFAFSLFPFPFNAGDRYRGHSHAIAPAVRHA